MKLIKGTKSICVKLNDKFIKILKLSLESKSGLITK